MGIDKDFRWGGKVDKYGFWIDGAEKRVAADITVAKRTRTQLVNMGNTFEAVIGADQLLAIKAAQAAASALITELERLQPFFRSYVRWKTAKDEHEKNHKLDQLAAQRWPSDAAALAEAEDLIAFYGEGAEGAVIDAFIAALHPGHQRIVREPSFFGCDKPRRDLAVALEVGNIEKIRRTAVSILNLMKFGETHRQTWFAGADDYDAWRAHRLQAGAQTPVRAPRDSSALP
jgi:hypothetical protein